MSTKNDLASVAEDLSVIGKTLAGVAENLIRTATRVKECLPDCLAVVPAEAACAAADSGVKAYPIGEIRSRLKVLIDAGYQAEVKALVKKYANGGNLTDVKPEKYPDLMKEAEKLSAW